MLVLSRSKDETIVIGDEIEVTVLDVRGERVRIGIRAPASISVHRKEVYEAIHGANVQAARTEPDGLKEAADLLGHLKRKSDPLQEKVESHDHTH